MAVLGISIDAEGEKVVRPFVREKGATFPVFLDKDMKVARSYQFYAPPTLILVDSKGRVVGRALGPRDLDKPEWGQLIAALKQG